MCDCIKEISKKLSHEIGHEGEIWNIDIMTGRTYSEFCFKVGRVPKKLRVTNEFCPFCGRKYENRAERRKAIGVNQSS